MKNCILIFGSSGFIGTHLIRRSAANGDDVVAVDVKPPRERISGVEYVVADVRYLTEFVPSKEITKIYNLAAVHTTPGHPTHEYYDTNIAGALQVTKLAEKIGTHEIVFTSSISVYGPSEDRKTEQSVVAPESAYGYSKWLAEEVHRGWLERGQDRKLTIARPAVVFGQGEGGNFTRLAALLKKGFFIYPGRKDTMKACIYVEDLIDALFFASTRAENYVLFNAAYPNCYTIEQIVQTVMDTSFPRAKTFLIPSAAMSVAATLLGAVGFMNIGLHPDRVKKLTRSTNIYPEWLQVHGFGFPESFKTVVKRWETATDGSFV